MATRNQLTGKYEAKREFNTGHVYIGVGDTKEEAKADLQKQLKEIEIDYGPYETPELEKKVKAAIRAGKIPKYRPPMKQIGTIRSPGFEMKLDDGVVKYEYNADRKAPVFGKAPTARQAAEDAAKQKELESKST